MAYFTNVDLGVGDTTPDGRLDVQAGAAGTVALIAQGAASQTADLLQAQTSTGTVLARIKADGDLEVKDTLIAGVLTVNGHIVTGNTSGSTTIAAGAGACTTPTVSVAGNDTAGTITVTTGTGCTGPGVLGTVTFASGYASAPRVVVGADNANAAGLAAYTGSRTTSTFTLDRS